MITNTYMRILCTLLALILSFVAPYWLVFAVVLAAAVVFEWYVEGIALGFVLDLLYGAPLMHFHSYLLINTLICTVIVFGASIAIRFTRYGHS